MPFCSCCPRVGHFLNPDLCCQGPLSDPISSPARRTPRTPPTRIGQTSGMYQFRAGLRYKPVHGLPRAVMDDAARPRHA